MIHIMNKGYNIEFCCSIKNFLTALLYTLISEVCRRIFLSNGILLNNLGPILMTLFLNKDVLNTGKTKLMLLLLVCVQISTSLKIWFCLWLLYINSNIKNLCINENFNIFVAVNILDVESNFFKKKIHRKILF